MYWWGCSVSEWNQRKRSNSISGNLLTDKRKCFPSFDVYNVMSLIWKADLSTCRNHYNESEIVFIIGSLHYTASLRWLPDPFCFLVQVSSKLSIILIRIAEKVNIAWITSKICSTFFRHPKVVCNMTYYCGFYFVFQTFLIFTSYVPFSESSWNIYCA